MRKTTFAGLTALGPEDSIFADGAAFTTRDRDEIDRGLKIGIKTHRHTGLPGLSDPTLAPSASIIASGGTIDSGLTITVGYTLEDTDGGETLISPLSVTSTQVPLDVPLNAPEAEADYTGGSLLTDNYTYAITYVDGEGGETPLGPATLVNRDPGFEEAQIKLKGLTKGLEEAGAAGWRLFRARGGGEFVLLATGDGSEDTFTDDGSVSPDCDTHPPTDNLNNTNKINTLQVKLPSPLDADAQFINLYATTTGGFGESSLLAQYPIASAGASPVFSSLAFLSSQPPDVNRSYGGANQIDPDTELLDWHWKRPVKTVSALPKSGNEEGDVRAILNEPSPTVYMYLDGEWQLLQSGGGGGTGGGFSLVISGSAAYRDGFASAAIDPGWKNVTEVPLSTDLKVVDEELVPKTGIEGIGLFLRRPGLPTADDLAMSFKTHIGAADSGTGLVAGAIFRVQEGEEDYIEVTYDNLGNVVASVHGTGSGVFLEAEGPILEHEADYWFRFILVGNELTVQVWEHNPENGGKPLFETSASITKKAAKESVGEGIKGGWEWWLPPVAADWSWDSFLVIYGKLFTPGIWGLVPGSGIVLNLEGTIDEPFITISATGGGGGGGGGSASLKVDADGTVIDPASVLEIEPGSNVTVTGSEPEPGVAHVVIDSTGGGGGGASLLRDLFPGPELDPEWEDLGEQEFPFVEEEPGFEFKEGLHAQGADNGVNLVRKTPVTDGTIFLSYKHGESSNFIEVGVICKWIDKDNYLVVFHFENTPYYEILGKWEGEEVINVFLTEADAPPKSASNEVVKAGVDFDENGVSVKWWKAGSIEPDWTTYWTIEKLIEENEAQEAGIRALLAASGKPGLYIKSSGGSITATLWEILTREERLSGILKEEGMGFIFHDEEAGHTRPRGWRSVTWMGSVEPENMVEGDIWIETP